MRGEKASIEPLIHSSGEGLSSKDGRETWPLEKLLHHIHQLETLHEEMIRSELDRLHELATLTRIADTLSQRRDFNEVLDDCLDEITRIVGTQDVWIVESKPGAPVDTIHRLNARGGAAADSVLPRRVRSLCQRIYANRPHQEIVVNDVNDANDNGDGDYFGAPIFTAKHLLGALVVRDDGHKIAGDENRIRLIQSVLRQAAMAAENDRLINVLNQMIVEVVCAFSLAIESRDPYTGGHVQRVTAYAVLLAEHIGLDHQQQSIIRLGGLLHDIGKVAIPDAVLNKPGKLTTEEFNIIKSHPVVGHQIVKQIPQLSLVHDCIRHHHERWDGKGYPDGLAGQNIPLLARVLAIADTFDAMTSNRSYRKAMPFDQAMKEIRNCAGSQFDAEMAASFSLFTSKALDEACERMRQWTTARNHDSSVTLMDLINLDMPSMVKTTF